MSLKGERRRKKTVCNYMRICLEQKKRAEELTQIYWKKSYESDERDEKINRHRTLQQGSIRFSLLLCVILMCGGLLYLVCVCVVRQIVVDVT